MLPKKIVKKKKNSKSKSKPKRMKTFTSSEFSLLEDRQYISVCDLFKNDALKKKNNTAMISSLQSSKPQKVKSQKNLNSTKRKLKINKSKGKLMKVEPYEVVKSKFSFNSQIIFSNEDTKRDDRDITNSEKTIAIKVKENYLIDNNQILRQSIKKSYLRKVEAAIKIQKVFRGYMTRKVLQKYVSNQQKLLSARLEQYKSSDISEHSSYFAEKSRLDSKRRPQSFMFDDNVGSRSRSTAKKDKQNAQNQQISSDELEQDKEENDRIAYRHQQPIYSHAEISDFLESSHSQEDFEEDAYEENIIFETNEEYIESRKNSDQPNYEPKNKLSRPHLVEAPVEPVQQNKQNQEIIQVPPNALEQLPNLSTIPTDLEKTEKKNDKQKYKINLGDDESHDEIKQETIKMTEESEGGIPANMFMDTITYDSAYKDLHEKQRIMKKIKPSQENNDVERLKQLELQKWDQMINLVSSQIQKTINNNTEINQFMKTIMDISMKNKELLEIKANIDDSSEFSTPINPKTHFQENSKSQRRKRKSQNENLSNLQYFDDDISEKQDISPVVNKEIEDLLRQSENQHEKQNQEEKPSKINDHKNFIKKFQLNDRMLFFNEENDEMQKERISDLKSPKSKENDRSNDPVNPLSPLSSFENTGKIKKFILGNLHDDRIEEMLALREEFLKKRENQALQKINELLTTNKISQEEFISKLKNLTEKIISEKKEIDKAREDINKGYRAALNLTKEACYDAKKLGYKLPISRSMDGLKFKNPLMFSEIIIDEIEETTKAKKKIISNKNEKNIGDEPISRIFEAPKGKKRINIDFEEESQHSDYEFTEQQLNRFRRAQPYDIQTAEQIADLNRNVMISEDFRRQQQQNSEEDDKESLMKTNRNIFRQIYEIEDTTPSSARFDPKVQMITEKELEFLIWEFAADLMVKPIFSERLIDKTHFYKPNLVNNQERSRFIALLEKNLPSINILNEKLNQKISPLPTELLKCMRIDFSEEEEDENSYEQIGKYQFIINQQICNKAVAIFKEQFEKEQNNNSFSALSEFQELEKEFQFNEKVSKYVNQRQKFLANRKKHTKQLRWEVLNIEIHCIFDSWNEELIQIRSQKTGYSGIGLNELTLSILDHNSVVPLHETMATMNLGKQKLLRTLGMIEFDSNPLSEEEMLLESDSKWIFYADQALSFGLELVYLIEEQIISECAKQIRKRIILPRRDL